MPASYPQLIHNLRRLVSPAADSKSDAELLDRFRRARDEAAFTDLMQRHGPMVWRLCRHRLGDDHAAEDAFQATFLILASRADSIRRAASLTAWLFGVALRVIGKARRQCTLAPLTFDVPAEDHEDPLAKMDIAPGRPAWLSPWTDACSPRAVLTPRPFSGT
jgi:DNA-directed RNA polymerase specialized sigma24 family protein